jgi:hypothetical protein
MLQPTGGSSHHTSNLRSGLRTAGNSPSRICLPRCQPVDGVSNSCVSRGLTLSPATYPTIAVIGTDHPSRRQRQKLAKLYTCAGTLLVAAALQSAHFFTHNNHARRREGQTAGLWPILCSSSHIFASSPQPVLLTHAESFCGAKSASNDKATVQQLVVGARWRTMQRFISLQHHRTHFQQRFADCAHSALPTTRQHVRPRMFCWGLRLPLLLQHPPDGVKSQGFPRVAASYSHSHNVTLQHGRCAATRHRKEAVLTRPSRAPLINPSRLAQLESTFSSIGEAKLSYVPPRYLSVLPCELCESSPLSSRPAFDRHCSSQFDRAAATDETS